MGHLLAKGGISEIDATALIAACEPQHRVVEARQAWGGVYGANMVVRASILEREHFDETLPLHGMTEDVDFGTRARRYGKIAYSYASLGVHLELRTRGSIISRAASPRL
jgi:GT2 family glycosyltransferase